MKWILFAAFSLLLFVAQAQPPDSIPKPVVTDTLVPQPIVPVLPMDTALRIINLNPFISLHVDSVLQYDLQVNKDSAKYFWYLRNSPVGLRINKDNGLLFFNADKSLFKSGRLKYDFEYKVQIGVQNVKNPLERVDTSFVMQFYNTEINVSKVKPSVSNTLYVEEGDSVAFRVNCENGTFPLESISLAVNLPISYSAAPTRCGESFAWSVPFDFIREGDTAKQRSVTLQFIGADKFYNRDTASVKIFVKEGVNYPLRYQEYTQLKRDVNRYINQLKYTFKQLDKKIKNTKTARTTFDLTAATTALSGTIISSTATNNSNSLGKVLPGIGVAMVPVKEAVAPQKNQEQNTTTQIRSVIKRLEYMQVDNTLVGNRDPEVSGKIQRMKTELKQAQLQLIDVPLADNDDETDREINEYFNDPKVNKKYRTLKK